MTDMDDAELLRLLADDSGLDEALDRQRRPARPGSPQEAREQVETLLVPGLVRDGFSEAEARIEAMNVLARFEIAAFERGRERGLKQAAEEAGEGI